MKNFSIARRQIDQISVLDVSGELDAHTASQLENSLQDLIAAKSIKIIVNCARLDYIASAGLGVFMDEAYREHSSSLDGMGRNFTISISYTF